MESRAKFLGHPLHQQLVALPLGLLPASLVFDIVGLIRGEPKWFEFAFWLLAGGVATGALAAVFGLWDWIAIPLGTRAKRIGLWHTMVMTTMLTLFAISGIIRFGNGIATPGGIPVVLSFIALGSGLLGAWFGGELVARLGVGVDDGAHVDAPSSLSKEPAGVSDSARTHVGAAAESPADTGAAAR